VRILDVTSGSCVRQHGSILVLLVPLDDGSSTMLSTRQGSNVISLFELTFLLQPHDWLTRHAAKGDFSPPPPGPHACCMAVADCQAVWLAGAGRGMVYVQQKLVPLPV
jgi:hypothetical protein